MDGKTIFPLTFGDEFCFQRLLFLLFGQRFTAWFVNFTACATLVQSSLCTCIFVTGSETKKVGIQSQGRGRAGGGAGGGLTAPPPPHTHTHARTHTHTHTHTHTQTHTCGQLGPHFTHFPPSIRLLTRSSAWAAVSRLTSFGRTTGISNKVVRWPV